MEVIEFAKLLKPVREKRALTQEKLARALEDTIETLNNQYNARRSVRAQPRRIEQIAESLSLFAHSVTQREIE